MRSLNYTNNFLKNYKKRFSHNIKLRKQIDERLKLFLKDPANSIHKDHKLSGAKKHLRSFSVTGNIRVIYYLKEDTIYLVDVGTHPQVY